MAILNKKGIDARAMQQKLNEENTAKMRKERVMRCLDGLASYKPVLNDICDTLLECDKQKVEVSREVGGNPLTIRCLTSDGERRVKMESAHEKGFVCEIIYYNLTRDQVECTTCHYDFHTTVGKDDLTQLNNLFCNDHFHGFHKNLTEYGTLIEAMEQMLAYLGGYTSAMVERLENL